MENTQKNTAAILAAIARGNAYFTALVEQRVAAVAPASMDLSALAEAGIRRERALAAAEAALVDGLEVLEAELDGGNVRDGAVNLTAAAELLGVARTTLYRRLEERAS